MCRSGRCRTSIEGHEGRGLSWACPSHGLEDYREALGSSLLRSVLDVELVEEFEGLLELILRRVTTEREELQISLLI